MVDTFPADEAKLVSIFCQTLLYGIFCVLFFASVYVLRNRIAAKTTGMGRTMMGTLFTMFILATIHIGVNFTRIIKAFIVFTDLPGGPSAYFNELSNFTNIFGTTIYVAQTLVGDGFVVYRCAIVWGRNYWVVAFPLLLLLGSTAAGVGILYSFAKITPDAPVFAAQLGQWIPSFFALTLATNLICTGLVAVRIWRINKLSRRVGPNFATSLTPVVVVVVESGMVYSATLAALLVTYECESWAQYLLLDAVSPIVGITFSLVILRLSLGLSDPDGMTRPFQDIPSNSALWGRQQDQLDTTPDLTVAKSVRDDSEMGEDDMEAGKPNLDRIGGGEEIRLGSGKKMGFGLGGFGMGEERWRRRDEEAGIDTAMSG